MLSAMWVDSLSQSAGLTSWLQSMMVKNANHKQQQQRESTLDDTKDLFETCKKTHITYSEGSTSLQTTDNANNQCWNVACCCIIMKLLINVFALNAKY